METGIGMVGEGVRLRKVPGGSVMLGRGVVCIAVWVIVGLGVGGRGV